MGTRNVDLICRRCGASASLPLGMSCDNHLPVPTPPDGWLLCLTCKGAGEVAEYHDYATEWLGCQDCMGLGSIRCEAEGHWFHGPDGTEHDPDEGPCEYPGELTGEPR